MPLNWLKCFNPNNYNWTSIIHSYIDSKYQTLACKLKIWVIRKLDTRICVSFFNNLNLEFTRRWYSKFASSYISSSFLQEKDSITVHTLHFEQCVAVIHQHPRSGFAGFKQFLLCLKALWANRFVALPWWIIHHFVNRPRRVICIGYLSL